MKRIAILQWNNLTYDLERELKKRGHNVFASKMIEQKDLGKFDILVTWNESQNSGSRDYIKYCKSLGIKTVLLQHGRRGTSRIYLPFNEDIVSDVVCSWSENDKKRLTSIGTSEDRIKVTGTTILRHLKPREKHEGINVIFNPEHWDTDVVENQIVAGTLRKLKGVKVITKILKGEHIENYYDNPVMSDRNKEGHLEICAEVLKIADLVVGISESTFELMAEILDIPVIIADIWIPKACGGDELYKEHKHEFSNACERIKLEDLNKTIYKRLKHPEYLREERKQIGIDDGGINILDPISEIIKVIENDK